MISGNNSLNVPRYTIKVRQQPLHARISGKGESVSKRVFQPPLILEVEFDDLNYSPSSTCLDTLSSLLVCNVALVSTEKEVMTKFIDKNGLLDNLLGSICILPFQGKDVVGGTEKLFFVLSDLAIRLPGEYILECKIFNKLTYLVY